MAAWAVASLFFMLISYGVSFYMSFCVWQALGFSMWKWAFLTAVHVVSLLMIISGSLWKEYHKP